MMINYRCISVWIGQSYFSIAIMLFLGTKKVLGGHIGFVDRNPRPLNYPRKPKVLKISKDTFYTTKW